MNRELIEHMSDEILKTAGFTSAVKGAGRFAGRTATGMMLGAGIGGAKGVAANDKSPDSPAETKETNVIGGLASGAILGGLAGGPGVSLAKKGFKGMGNSISGIFKKSEMEVPTDEEKGIKKDDDRKDVLNSPNDEEKSRMLSSEEKKDYYKREIEKLSKYMKDVKCESCGVEITPNSTDGRCPDCGALGGVAPKENVNPNADNSLYSKDLRLGRIYDEVQSAKRERYDFY